ncbi:vWA domain-containing protein [Actinomadura sp. HBU206391]|uniref:vWA domain-containing protein n=1 Tax=Actinomadura sp. HBU206391 TaxID=2731692 RepID=UPI00164EE500|nr:von Willebrand factor type A domain-containing protein [Actinomadura sp. HBU206391]MBC6460020.1 von Willebrand factor type A domain-containing protein [Actinomadura sp. HBU206391]
MRIRRTALAVTALSIALVATGCSGDGSRSTNGESGKAASAPKAGADAGPNRRPPGEGRPGEAPSRYLSTFALDVDTASYGFARRALTEGRRPDPSTVRPEEFVNQFRQDYAEPSGNGFSVAADGGRLTGSGGEEASDGDVRLLRVGLQTRSASAGTRRDANLTFVVDTSGSMAEPGRLDLVKDALHTLVDQLRPSDSVAIVAYEDDARLVREMTPVARKAELHKAIGSLSAGQSTNLEAGMVLGYQAARRGFREGVTNRVILASDGLANTGATAAAPILRRVSEEAAKGISLLCVGVGSDYGDKLMEQLADSGDGRAVYVSDQEKARNLFTKELPATVELRARDAKAQVGFDPRQVESYRLIGFDDRGLKNEDFRNDAADGGEIGPGHAVTALFAVRLKPDAEGHLADVTVRWTDPDTREAQETGRTVTVADLAPGLWTAGSPRLRVSAAAAFFAENLRDGHPGYQPQTPYVTPSAGPFVSRGLVPGEPRVGLDELAGRVTELASTTEDDDVAELRDLIRRAREA